MPLGPPLSRATKLRMVAGFLLVPPVLGASAFVVFSLLHSADALPYSGRLINPTGAAAGVGLVVCILAVLVTVGGALPFVLTTAERGPIALRRLLLAGAALGNAPLALIIVGATTVNVLARTPERGGGLYEVVPTLVRVMIGTTTGLLGAAVFWRISIRHTELDPAYQPADDPLTSWRAP